MSDEQGNPEEDKVVDLNYRNKTVINQRGATVKTRLQGKIK